MIKVNVLEISNIKSRVSLSKNVGTGRMVFPQGELNKSYAYMCNYL